MAQRMIRSRSDWKKAWTEDDIYNQFVKDNPQHKAAARDEVVQAYLEQANASGAPLYEAFDKEDGASEYLQKLASKAAPDALRWAGNTGAAVVQTTTRPASSFFNVVNPFQSAEGRRQAIESLATGPKTLWNSFTGVVDYLKDRFRGAPEAIVSSAMPGTETGRAAGQLAEISPAAQSMRDQPATFAADSSAVIGGTAGAIRGSTAAIGAISRQVRRAPGMIGQMAEAVNTSPSLSRLNTIGNDMSAVADTIDPWALSSRGLRAVASTRLPMKARRWAARGLMGGVLDVHARDPKDVAVMMDTVMDNRIPIGKSALQGGKPSSPIHMNVEQRIAEIDAQRNRGLSVAARHPTQGTVDTATIPNGARDAWDAARASGEATDRLGTAWDTIDQFIRTQGSDTGVGLRPELRPGSMAATKATKAAGNANKRAVNLSESADIAFERAERLRKIADEAPEGEAKITANVEAVKAEAEAKRLSTQAANANAEAIDLDKRLPTATTLSKNPQNPTFDESVHPTEPPANVPIGKIDAYRKKTNQELDDFYSNVLERGKEDPAMKNLIKKGMRDEAAKLEAKQIGAASREKFAQERAIQGQSTTGAEFDAALEASDYITENKFKQMGKIEHVLMEIRAAIKNSMVKHGKRAVPVNEQPYMVGQAGSTVTSLISGQVPGPTSMAAAALFNLRILGKYAPERTSRIALSLYHVNPDPKFWGDVLNMVRVMEEGRQQAAKSPQAKEPAPPPKPPASMQAKPSGDFDNGPGDFN